MTKTEFEFWLYSAGIGLLVFGGAWFYYVSGRATPVTMMGVLMAIIMYLGLVSAGREADKDGSRGEEIDIR